MPPQHIFLQLKILNPREKSHAAQICEHLGKSSENVIYNSGHDVFALKLMFKIFKFYILGNTLPNFTILFNFTSYYSA